MAVAVETSGLTRRFGTALAVDHVSLTTPERSVYGFLGRNGAGKTTTIRMLLGLLTPSAGSVRIFGVDVGTDRIAAARKVGVLLEAHGFYANLSGRENLELTRTLLGVKRTEIARVLDIVEMTAHAKRRVSDYSLGMRQRLGIARAMLGAPPLLILDEPTNGLDPDGIADMRELLRSLPERTGATILLSSHLLGEIERIATHVGILRRGRLALEGPLAALKADIAPELAIETDDPQRAATLVAAHGFTLGPSEDNSIAARLRPGDDARAAVAALNRALVEAGLGVFAIGLKPRSLESIYRAISQTTPEPL